MAEPGSAKSVQDSPVKAHTHKAAGKRALLIAGGRYGPATAIESVVAVCAGALRGIAELRFEGTSMRGHRYLAVSGPRCSGDRSCRVLGAA